MRDTRASMPMATPPQYILVAQALIKDIEQGRYTVGDLLPPELELCTQFGVSRHTMREAIRKLQEHGLITRQRGVGTRVKTTKPQSRYVQSATAISDLLQYVKDTRLVTTRAEAVIADAALAEKIKCQVGQRWMYVTGFRYAGKDKLPLALTEVYINPAFADVQKLIGTLKVPVHTLIERQFGAVVVEVRQEIRAIEIAAGPAKQLSVKPGSAGLLITRQYLGANDQVIEVTVNLHPATRFSYVTSLRLQVPALATA
jgi:DNA-binding GntR family transcriptional regulator